MKAPAAPLSPSIELRDVTIRYDVDYAGWTTLKDWFVYKLGKGRERQLQHIDAVKGLTLRIGQGERVGIIGRNGAGKSTLLRAIAGIYPPFGGEVAVTGRVRGLFDLSLGFEPDASGWENMLFRGMLLGEKPDVVRAKMPAMAAFTELGEFLDVPVKCYSSGMLVRLAFAISSSINGEILLLDEVVAAGDLHFQKKARERLREMIGKASILVLVSHDLAAVRELCTRALWLEAGKVRMDGEARSVVESYRASQQ